MYRLIRPTGVIFLVYCLSVQLALAQTAAPPSKPFLRIETGMHTAAVNRIGADASERFLVTASDDKTARVWDLRTGELLQVLRPPQGDGVNGKLYAVAISPDGGMVAVGGNGISGRNASIYLFDRASGKLVKDIEDLPDAVDHLSFSLADGRYLAAALGSHGIRVYRAPDYQEIARDTDYRGSSYSVEFDRAGRLVTTCDDGALRLYDAAFHMTAKHPAPGGKHPFLARFSPDGRKVAVGFDDTAAVNVLSGDDLAFLYAAETGQAGSEGFPAVAWSADGQILYAAGRYDLVDGPQQIWHWADSGRGAASAWPAAHNTIMDLRALSAGRLLFGSSDPAIGMLDADGHVVWQHTPEILDHRDSLDQLRLSRTGSVVEFGFKVLSPQGDWIRRLARFDVAEHKLQLDPEPDRAVTAPRIAGLNVADWQNKDKPTFSGHVLPLEPFETSRSLAISANAATFLLGTDWYLRLYERRGRPQWKQLTPAPAWAVNLSGDQRYAVAALGDGTLRWYAMEDGQEVLALFVHPDGKRWVAWTPEGFFDASPGGEALIGYHINQGADRAGEFIRVDQVFDLFYRSDLVAGRLGPGGAEAVRTARAHIGDVAEIVRGGLPPQLALVSPAETQSQGDFQLQFRVADAGGGIGRVVYRINGVEIEGREAGITLPGQGVQNRRFQLGPGTNEISVTVYNGNNQLESRSITAKVNVTAAERQPALFVVALGVSHYKDSSLDKGVKFAASDAATLVARLKEQNKGLFSAVTPYILSDDKATRDNLDNTISEAASHMKPDDVFVLYLAGHGTTAGGRYYFVPWEAPNVNGDALLRQSLDEDALRKMLSRIVTKKTLLILDTCSSGAFSPLEEEGATGRIERITGRAVMEASASDQMALEGYNGHSVLVAALLDGLSQATDSQGLVQVSRLGDFVTDSVPKITKDRWHYVQTPQWFFQGPTFAIARKP